MTLMADFDIITEISKPTLLNLIKKNMTIGGNPANPPFEFSIPINAAGTTGHGHMIVTDLLLDLINDHDIRLKLPFSNSSVIIDSPMQLPITLLDGLLTITSSLQFVNTNNPDEKTLATNLGSAVVSLTFSPAAQTRISNALSGTPISAATFINFANQAAGGYVHAMGQQNFPIAFKVKNGVNGFFSPNLQFEKLEVHNISNLALGLFGILLTANHNHGNAALKNTTAITAGHDVAVSISPGAFHSLVFCPSVASALGTSVNKLPTSCGSSGSFTKDGVDVTKLSDTFGSGHIDINGSVKKSGFCYDAHGTFHGRITMTMSGTKLKPNLAMDQPNVDVDIPWYCWLAAGVILGPIGLVITAIVNDIASTVANNLAKSAVNGALGNSLPSVGIAGLSGATFNSVMTTSEGLTLNGNVTVLLPAPQTKGLEITGSVITDQLSQKLNEKVTYGTYHADEACVKGDFPYVEKVHSQTGNYTVIPHLLGEPLTLEWRVEYWQGYWGYNSSPNLISAANLTGNNGKITLNNVTCGYAMPLPGGSEVTQPIHFNYSTNGNAVHLTSVQGEGNYGLSLSVKATDPMGNVIERSTGMVFQGDEVVIGGDYQQKVSDCMHQLIDKMSHYAYKQKFPSFPPVNYPNPETIVTFIHDVAALGTQEADTVLALTKLAHGKSYFRGMLSRETANVGLPAEQVSTQEEMIVR